MRRILLVRTDRVGDVIMITPAIRELRKQFPDSYIATLTHVNTKAVLENNPHLNALLIDDLTKNSFWKVIGEIRKHKFTDALLFIPTERAAYQLFFSGISNRIGVGRKLYEVITFMKSVSRNKYIPLRHESDYCMDLARRLDVNSSNLKPEIFLTEDEKVEGKNFLKRIGVLADSFKIIIHTGSGKSSPNWSEKKYFELIQALAGKYGERNISILLTAREMSEEFVSEVNKFTFKNIFNISKNVEELRFFIKVISAVDLAIGSSTGPMHIADALDKRSIVFHCHRPMSCSKRWGMFNPDSVNLEVSQEHCSEFCSADKSVCDIENGIAIKQIFDELSFGSNGENTGIN